MNIRQLFIHTWHLVPFYCLYKRNMTWSYTISYMRYLKRIDFKICTVVEGMCQWDQLAFGWTFPDVKVQSCSWCYEAFYTYPLQFDLLNQVPQYTTVIANGSQEKFALSLFYSITTCFATSDLNHLRHLAKTLWNMSFCCFPRKGDESVCSGAVDVSMPIVRIEHFKPGNSMPGTQRLTIDGCCFRPVVACFSRVLGPDLQIIGYELLWNWESTLTLLPKCHWHYVEVQWEVGMPWDCVLMHSCFSCMSSSRQPPWGRAGDTLPEAGASLAQPSETWYLWGPKLQSCFVSRLFFCLILDTVIFGFV